jgi:hypothetical protein
VCIRQQQTTTDKINKIFRGYRTYASFESNLQVPNNYQRTLKEIAQVVSEKNLQVQVHQFEQNYTSPLFFQSPTKMLILKT